MFTYKKIGSIAVVGLLSLTVTQSAFAYSLEGGKLSAGPYYTKFWNDSSTSSNGISFWLAVQNGVSSWNNTQNTKVWMVQANTQAESIMDFHTTSMSDPNTYGVTTVWNGTTQVPFSQVWYWSKSVVNTSADWKYYDNGDLSRRANVVKEVAAHEEGHALGLDHVSWLATESEHLMYYSPAPTAYNVFGPVADDVAGVQAIYGTLR